MLGILIVVLGSLLDEATAVTNKITLKQHTLTVLDTALLILVAGTIPFALIAFVAPQTFVFTAAALPTFSLRFLLEIAIILVGGYALLRADRSTFALLRTLTIPLLLIIDLMLVYPVTGPQIAGALIITVALAATAFGKISRNGIFLCICSAVLATATISLFKIDIQHNSVVAEQLVMHTLLIMAFIPLKVALREPWPLHVLRRGREAHSTMVTAALGSMLGSYAYALVPGTALVTAGKRGISVLFALGSGKIVFHEQHFGKRLALGTAVITGIALMATPETFFTEGYQLAATFLSY
ncbi:hypothetical protein A3C87_00975 [Candidatus Kaiserbacteria bacterium RIFCSPHIGHO2_02_FULL_49_34]|uniref:EamA domain-containing protein n=1 Tax=Candidatus Kaiserbacteria bacterium RIFCSPHIGHO2_02_FULL_49_34 TaxID=1798491 RepID=A0A1F6DMK0_9BACT|nr:MAG: hypothetical protein A3C87_00975 [Candidatus Kaiserbacteria bacterium RIFCSPHIGHO2_02_FULL_49_34]